MFTYDNDRRKLETDHHIGTYTGTLNAASKTIYGLLGRVTEEDTAKCIGTASPCGLTGSAVATWIPSKVNTYTPTSKVATVTDADGALTSTTYDNADRVYVVTDPANRQTQFIDDAAGNVLQEIRGLGSPVQMTYAAYQYLPDGEKLSVQDADGPTHITTYSYDGFNRLVQTLYPDSTSEQVTLYDANGNVKTRVNRANQTFTMTYDSLNRLSTKVVPSYTLSSGTVPANTITNLYDLGGRLQQTSDTVGNVVDPSYDTAGRAISTATTIAGLSGALTSQYQLDANSNRTQLQWPDGYQVNYAYDTLNRMTTATDSASTTLATYAYDAMSRRSSLTYGNTASLAYTYSDAGDLLTLLNDFTNNTKNVSYTLGYSPDHQLASEANSQSSYVWQPSLTGGTDSYATVNAVNQYGSMTPAGGSAQAMTYDGNGNLTGDGTLTLAYDPENHLVAAGGSTSARYAFDPLGQRQTKTVGATITNFLNDSGDEIAEYDGSGNVLRRFIPGHGINEPIAYESCTGIPPVCTGASLVTEYYHTDHHGSIIGMSGSNGNPVTAESGLTYDSYGNNPTMVATGQPFRYVGMYFDVETGLYHDRARCYIPNLGRFCQNDPIGYKDDVDLYTYAGDDPTDKIDPTGQYKLVNCDTIQCQDAAIKFENGRKQDIDPKNGYSPEVVDAAKAWGDPGDPVTDSHVTVSFESQDDTNNEAQHEAGFVVDDDLHAGSDPSTGPYVHLIVSTANTNWAQNVAHNGSHIQDHLGFLNSYNPKTGKFDASKNFTLLQTETRAYNTGSMVTPYTSFTKGDAVGLKAFIQRAYRQWHAVTYDPKTVPQE